RWFTRPTLFDIWRKLITVNGGAHPDERALADLRAGRAMEVVVELTPQRRGVLRFESLTLAQPDPLNLFTACADYRAQDTVLVLPTFASRASEDAFEEAVAVAASFAASVDTRECLLDLMFVGRETYCFTAGRGQMQAQQLLEVLAAVSPHAGEFRTLADSVL